MKTKKFLISVLLVIIFTIPASSMDFIVGAKSGYSVWRPYFKDIGGFFDNIETGTGVLYGPVLSVIFTENLSFSFAGLTGQQNTEWNMDYKLDGSKYRAGTYFWNSERYDIDSALSYRLFGSFKVFLGYKLQYMDSQFMQTESRFNTSTHVLDQLYHSKDNISTLSQGPAIGAGYAFVFGKGFFSAVNLSFLYMRGYFKVKTDFSYQATTKTTPDFVWTENPDGMDFKKDTIQMGVNFEPSIGYKAEEIGLIFTVGFRFQWLSTELQDIKATDEIPTKAMNDYLGGIYVSVLYNF